MDEMAGLLGQLDPDLLRKLAEQFRPSDDERVQARQHALLTAGLGILAGHGNLGQVIGQGGLLGAQAYQGALGDVQKQRMQALQMAPALQGMADDARYRQVAQQYNQRGMGASGGPSAAPTAPPPAASAYGMQDRSLGAPGPALPQLGAPPSVQPRLSQNKMSDYQQAIEKAKYYEQAGLPPKYVEAAFAQAEKLRPEVKETKTLTDATGQRVTVNIYKDGTAEVVPFGPDKEKAHFLDVGNKIGAVDPFTGQPVAGGGMYNKAVTPGEQLSANTTMRGQNMTDARARELNALTRGAGELKETDQGLVRIGRDNSVTPIQAEGKQLQPPLTGALRQQMASNNVTMQKIDGALGLVQQTPDAFGVKNYLGDPIRQRTDPGGVTARATVADIAGQKIHDRSGGAVTIGEAERLKPYVPNVTDTPETVTKKLIQLRREYVLMQNELGSGKTVAEVANRRAAPAKVIDFASLPK